MESDQTTAECKRILDLTYDMALGETYKDK